MRWQLLPGGKSYQQLLHFALDGIADRDLCRFIAVGCARPEEAFQSVSSPPRHDMDVQMRHGLAHSVIDGYERSFRVHG